MTETRATRAAMAIMLAGLLLVATAAAVEAQECNWDLALFGVLLAFSIFSDLTAVSTESKVKVSGSFLALVVAMVFLGGAPAALIGVVTILVGWFRWRDEPHYLVNNVLTYALFPLLGGVLFLVVTEETGITQDESTFYLLVFGLFQVSLALNFVFTAGYRAYMER